MPTAEIRAFHSTELLNAYEQTGLETCRHDFSLTSGTLFAWHKLPLRTYPLAVVAFCNEMKGKSMLAFARDLDAQCKMAFVLWRISCLRPWRPA